MLDYSHTAKNVAFLFLSFFVFKNKMTGVFLFLLSWSLSVPLSKCRGMPVMYAVQGHAFLLLCDPDQHGENVTYIWTKDNKTLKETPRIKFQGSSIWLLSTVSSDSGTYRCRSTDSSVSMETVVFLSVESGSCPSPNMFKVAWRGSNFNFSCAEEIPTSGQLLQVHLWKDCKSTGLEGHEISFFNMSMSDMGNYTCMVIFKYAGKNYTASLTTKIAVINGDETQKKPEVISPRDNTVHVKPGERMKLDCIVFIGTEDTRSETSMYWTINDSYTWTYPQIHENVTFERKDDNNVYGHSTLIIPEVLPEFFGVIFKCIVRNPSGEDMGVVHLRQDDDNTIQIVLIVSVLVVVVVTVLFMVFKADIILAYHDLAGTGKAANDDGKAYDAYVSCYPGHGPGSSRVEDLALRLLPEVLEQQHNIRLFIHGRDDTDDEVNLAAMTDVIGQSRTVVLILHRLSPANQENQALVPISQGRDMLNASQCEDLCSAIAQCRVPVILVEGEKNVDYSLLPECLQAVRSLSVLRWSPTARPSGRFWKQLRYRMT